MPASITRLSKFTIPIAGLNPQGAGMATHNMISPVAGVREGKQGAIEGGTCARWGWRKRNVKENEEKKGCLWGKVLETKRWKKKRDKEKDKQERSRGWEGQKKKRDDSET